MELYKGVLLNNDGLSIRKVPYDQHSHFSSFFAPLGPYLQFQWLLESYSIQLSLIFHRSNWNAGMTMMTLTLRVQK